MLIQNYLPKTPSFLPKTPGFSNLNFLKFPKTPGYLPKTTGFRGKNPLKKRKEKKRKVVGETPVSPCNNGKMAGIG